MKTITVSYTYDVKGWISGNHILTTCGKVIEVKKGREVVPVLRGSKKAWYINGEYLTELKLIENKTVCPF